jgi:hypothetical protein
MRRVVRKKMRRRRLLLKISSLLLPRLLPLICSGLSLFLLFRSGLGIIYLALLDIMMLPTHFGPCGRLEAERFHFWWTFFTPFKAFMVV